ncbi:MAG: hypothetical protein K2W96_11170 [Gemmataceae bacterium]|nr:hypothetical protein [Gemmataceae bacterium]
MFRTMAAMAALSLTMLGSHSAEAQGPLPLGKVKPGFFKKMDPEIRAVQMSLRASKARLQKALADEVAGEGGAVEGKVIDQLKMALKAVDRALLHADLAQKLDKGGD